MSYTVYHVIYIIQCHLHYTMSSTLYHVIYMSLNNVLSRQMYPLATMFLQHGTQKVTKHTVIYIVQYLMAYYRCTLLCVACDYDIHFEYLYITKVVLSC